MASLGMETDYNFWADLLTTYRSNPDWLKFLWIAIPAAMLVLAGHGLSRLLQAAIGGRENSQQSTAYRGWIDEHGVLYMEQIGEMPPAAAAAAALPWNRTAEDRTSRHGA